MNAQGVERGISAPMPERAHTQEIGPTAPSRTMPLAPTASGMVAGAQANPIIPSRGNVSAAASPISDLDPEFEKKWVNAAKAIVERTQGDPHRQSQELSKAGEEYRKRIGRRADPIKE